MIDPELRDIITQELAEGEALLWASRSVSTKPDTTSIGYSLFGGLFCLLVLFWSGVTFVTTDTLSNKILILLPTMIAGWILLEIIKSNFFKRKPLLLSFAITNKRLVVIDPETSDRESYGQNILENIKLTERTGVWDLNLSDGDVDIYIDIQGVRNGREAEKLLVQYFLIQKEKTP